MGSMESDYMKAKKLRDEAERQRVRRWARRQQDSCSTRQADYIIGLGERCGMTPSETLAWIVDLFVPHYAREDVTGLMDVTKHEASDAIARLKKDAASRD